MKWDSDEVNSLSELLLRVSDSWSLAEFAQQSDTTTIMIKREMMLDQSLFFLGYTSCTHVSGSLLIADQSKYTQYVKQNAALSRPEVSDLNLLTLKMEMSIPIAKASVVTTTLKSHPLK